MWAPLPNDRIVVKAPEKDRDVRCQTASELRADPYRRIDSVRPFENMLIPFQNVAGWDVKVPDSFMPALAQIAASPV